MKEALFEVIDRLGGELTALSDDIFDHPEVGYEEYRVVRVAFHQTWTDQAIKNRQLSGDGEYIREMAVGKGRDGWKIFEAGNPQEL